MSGLACSAQAWHLASRCAISSLLSVGICEIHIPCCHAQFPKRPASDIALPFGGGQDQMDSHPLSRRLNPPVEYTPISPDGIQTHLPIIEASAILSCWHSSSESQACHAIDCAGHIKFGSQNPHLANIARGFHLAANLLMLPGRKAAYSRPRQVKKRGNPFPRLVTPFGRTHSSPYSADLPILSRHRANCRYEIVPYKPPTQAEKRAY